MLLIANLRRAAVLCFNSTCIHASVVIYAFLLNHNRVIAGFFLCNVKQVPQPWPNAFCKFLRVINANFYLDSNSRAIFVGRFSILDRAVSSRSWNKDGRSVIVLPKEGNGLKWVKYRELHYGLADDYCF